MATVIVRPNNKGNIAGWSLATIGASRGYLAVNESVADDDTSYIYSEYISDTVTFKVGSSALASTDVISSVQITADVKAVNAVSSLYEIVLRTHNNLYTSTDIDSGTSTSYIVSSYTWNNNPATNDVWTLDELNNLEIGVKKVNTQGQRCTQLYATITYTTPANIVTQQTLTDRNDMKAKLKYRAHVLYRNSYDYRGGGNISYTDLNT